MLTNILKGRLVMEHVTQWRTANNKQRDKLIEQWLGTQWSINIGGKLLTGELRTIHEMAYVTADDIEPSFEIEVMDPDNLHGSPLFVRAHFERFFSPEVLYEHII